jgi:hypothetical protein
MAKDEKFNIEVTYYLRVELLKDVSLGYALTFTWVSSSLTRKHKSKLGK